VHRKIPTAAIGVIGPTREEPLHERGVAGHLELRVATTGIVRKSPASAGGAPRDPVPSHEC
jgi:hypothetical protein